MARRVYLDVSALSRPLDDQHQARIRAETDAVDRDIQGIQAGRLEGLASEILHMEIEAHPDAEKREHLLSLVPTNCDTIVLSPELEERAATLTRLGFRLADALHIASAEVLQAEVLLSCDDRLCRRVRRHQDLVGVRVVNPCDFVKEL